MIKNDYIKRINQRLKEIYIYSDNQTTLQKIKKNFNSVIAEQNLI